MAFEETMVWAIQHRHPRSVSIDPDTFASTRAKAEQKSLDKFVALFPADGYETWHQRRRDRWLRAVHVFVRWEVAP